MKWNCDERVNARNYIDPDERKAFIAAYSDGYYHYPFSDDKDWPNAYGAGYWEGNADSLTT